MSENRDQRAIQRLMDDLDAVDGQTLSASVVDNEMLSLIVDEASKGIDIAERYPEFYKKLLDNSNLREAFLDTLESIESSEDKELISSPSKSSKKLSFLKEWEPQATIAKLGNKWRASWQQRIEQLQSIISLVQLATRSDPMIYEDPWITILRSETEIEKVKYTIFLECTLSKKDEEALSPFLNVAVTLGTDPKPSYFPIRSTLQWGTYEETIDILEEGRAKFPDIPFKLIFDEEIKHINAELRLTIESGM
jgi:hypothetical protein